LPAELLRPGRDDRRVAHRHRVDADLLGPGGQHRVHVLQVPDAAAHGERDEDVAGDRTHGLEVRPPPLGARRDVVEDDLVDAVRVHEPGDLGGVPDVDVVLEPARLGDPAALDVEAGDDAGGQHAGTD